MWVYQRAFLYIIYFIIYLLYVSFKIGYYYIKILPNQQERKYFNYLTLFEGKINEPFFLDHASL